MAEFTDCSLARYERKNHRQPHMHVRLIKILYRALVLGPHLPIILAYW